MGLFDWLFGKQEPIYGTITTTNGQYEGYLVNGKPHGQGVFLFNDGGRYEGQFVKGKMQGRGVMDYTVPSTGYRYEGEFVNGNRHGQGVYTFPSGNYYVGEFTNNEIHGKGILYDEDGKPIQIGRWEHYRYIGNPPY